MADMEEKKSSSAKLNGFMEKNKAAFLCGLCAVVVAVVVFVVVDIAKNKATENALSKIDEISYALTNGSMALEEDALAERIEVAKEALIPYAKKGGIAGVRANMLCAEIAFKENNYSDALECWKNVASKGKKMYTAPLACYNMAVCYEQLDDLENAAVNYKAAADYNEFMLKNHAKFSYGRVLESMGKYTEAVAVYQELNDAAPEENWSMIAKSRIIYLQTQGKAE